MWQSTLRCPSQLLSRKVFTNHYNFTHVLSTLAGNAWNLAQEYDIDIVDGKFSFQNYFYRKIA
jgi:hypothetical protein